MCQQIFAVLKNVSWTVRMQMLHCYEVCCNVIVDAYAIITKRNYLMLSVIWYIVNHSDTSDQV